MSGNCVKYLEKCTACGNRSIRLRKENYEYNNNIGHVRCTEMGIIIDIRGRIVSRIIHHC